MGLGVFWAGPLLGSLGPEIARMIVVLFGTWFWVALLDVLWVYLAFICPPLGTLFAYFWGAFFWVRKMVSPKRFLGCFWVPADTREPRFRLSQTQFCTNQRFSESVAFFTPKSLQNELGFAPWGVVVWYFFRCVFDFFFFVAIF